VLAGANYGWRVYEGFACTNNDPGLCNPANYVPPVFDYAHLGGRCSITGGYPYRGSLETLPAGTYIYGDYCSGEILTWDGTTQTLEIDTSLHISSFGEDEFGELYVVGLGGTISRVDAVATTCTPAIDPTSGSFASTGGTGSVTVTAADGCSWTAAANDQWIHVTAGASGKGNGTADYSVDANATGGSRTGTMTIADRTFTVTQTGVACTVAISPTNAAFDSNGGTATVGVMAPDGCSWAAVANDDWIHVTAGGNGSGNGTADYSVDANAAGATRTGTMTIADKTFTVTQTGVAIACTFAISPAKAAFENNGGTATVAVTAPDGCSWTAVSNDSWITITDVSSTSGDGIVTYSVTVYTGRPRRRGGTMTIAGETFSVKQSK
jgi:hypothetical protein